MASKQAMAAAEKIVKAMKVALGLKYKLERSIDFELTGDIAKTIDAEHAELRAEIESLKKVMLKHAAISCVNLPKERGE